MDGIYEVEDIARYVINRSWENNQPISNLKLQKILYLIQGNFLRVMNRVCFNSTIEAWDYGPVVPAIYSQYKSFGSNYIPRTGVVARINNSNFSITEDNFNMVFFREDDRNVIDNIIGICAEYSAIALMRLTHQQTPWIEAYSAGRSSEIGVEAIREYFADDR